MDRKPRRRDRALRHHTSDDGVVIVMAMSNAEKVRAYRERLKAKKAAEMASLGDPRLVRLLSLIAEAESLAAELNAEAVERLRSQKLTRETVRKLDAIEGKHTTIRLPKFHS